MTGPPGAPGAPGVGRPPGAPPPAPGHRPLRPQPPRHRHRSSRTPSGAARARPGSGPPVAERPARGRGIRARIDSIASLTWAGSRSSSVPGPRPVRIMPTLIIATTCSISTCSTRSRLSSASYARSELLLRRGAGFAGIRTHAHEFTSASRDLHRARSIRLARLRHRRGEHLVDRHARIEHSQLPLGAVQRRQLHVEPQLVAHRRRPGEQPVDRLGAGIQLSPDQID